MGSIKTPEPVKLICSIFAGQVKLLDEAQGVLEWIFGPIDFLSELLPFDHTTYYEPEFGPGLVRRILAFERLIDPGALADIKRTTNNLEQRWEVNGRRQVNIDPGYISLGKLVLASTKDHSHRIYLRDGIYAEVTLRFQGGKFQPWEWTYPDYASPAYCAMFARIREIYRAQLRAGKGE